MKIKSIVRTYVARIRSRAKEELDWFRHQPNLNQAIEYAGLAVNSKCKRYAHQRRIKKTTLEQAKKVLLINEKAIGQCKDFDELFALIEAVLKPISGIGELYVYDTALRIGAYQNLLPTKVYMHAGTRIGAQALGYDCKLKTLNVSALPKALRELEPHEIEDALCIFKNELREIGEKIGEKEMISRSWCG